MFKMDMYMYVWWWPEVRHVSSNECDSDSDSDQPSPAQPHLPEDQTTTGTLVVHQACRRSGREHCISHHALQRGLTPPSTVQTPHYSQLQTPTPQPQTGEERLMHAASVVLRGNENENEKNGLEETVAPHGIKGKRTRRRG